MFRPTFENLERREVFSGEPLPMEEVTDLVIDPFDRNVLIGTDGGIWRLQR